MKPTTTRQTPEDIIQDMLENVVGKVIKPDVLLAEIDALLRARPSIGEIADDSEAVLSWRGRVAAVLKAWDGAEVAKLIFIDGKIDSSRAFDVNQGYRQIIGLLHQARHTIQMQTIGPVSAAIEKGGVFDYFDELRKIVERTSSEILFVDPYLDADFVGRYLPYVPKGARIRLLTSNKKLATLLPAVDAFAAQHNIKIEVRTNDQLHDRYVFLDGKECFQSGASFKDGAVKAPTTLTQITDAFAAMATTYEGLWKTATVHR